MESITFLNYHITVCAANFICRGTVPIPAFRRFSDFVNDPSERFLTLDEATTETWDGTALGLADQPTRIVVNKQSLVAVLLARDAPTPRADPTEIVPKLPVSVKILAPPLLLEGNWYLARGVDWYRAMTVLRDDFLIVTTANVDYLKTNTRIEEKLPVVFVRRASIGLFQVNPSPQE